MGSFLDCVRPEKVELKAIEKKVGKYLSTILMINATRISNDFDERVLESRRHFEKEVMDSFDNLIASAEDAVERASTVSAKGARAIEGRVQQLKSLLERLTWFRGLGKEQS